MDASVAEIHYHPLRPHGYEEPLFFGRAAKKRIAEHLKTSSSWLRKAGEAHAEDLGRTGEVCHVLQRPDGSAYLVRAGRRRPGTRRRETSGYAKRRIARVIERWREVRGWWNRDGIDRLCFRVVLDGGEAGGEAGGAVVDLALDRTGPRSGSWSLLRVLD